MKVSTMLEEERREQAKLSREEKDANIIRATEKRLGRTSCGATIIYTDGGGGM
jgi:hypothetical protein